MSREKIVEILQFPAERTRSRDLSKSLSDRFYPETALTGPTIDSFRWQETTFVVLAIAVYVSFFFEALFFPRLFGTPKLSLLLATSIPVSLQFFEVLWLRLGKFEFNERIGQRLTYASIVLNLTAAIAIVYIMDAPDSPIASLLVLPVLMSAVRLSFPAMLAVVAAASSINVFSFWIYFEGGRPAKITEYFEASTVAFIFLVVGTLVWISVDFLRRKEALMAEHLHNLEATRTKLEAEERLAAVGRLSAAIAHEIRNPLAMITSSLAMARRNTDEDSRQEMFEIVATESERLERLTNDFLAYAKPRIPKRQASSVLDCLHYVAGICRARTAEKGVAIVIPCSEDIWAFMDSSQIQQALLNLLMNAIDASAENAIVVLNATTDKAANQVVITIANGNGPIAAETVERLFEPFFTTKPSGTGLGLPIAHNIAKSNAGTLVLTQNTEEKVCFTLRLPAASAPRSPLAGS